MKKAPAFKRVACFGLSLVLTGSLLPSVPIYASDTPIMPTTTEAQPAPAYSEPTAPDATDTTTTPSNTEAPSMDANSTEATPENQPASETADKNSEAAPISEEEVNTSSSTPDNVAMPRMAAAAPESSTSADSSLNEVWLSTTGNDANDGSAADKAVKELATALRLVKDGGTIHTAGKYSVDNLTIDKNVTFQGTDEFLTVTSQLSAAGKTVTMSGYKTALTINAGAKLADGIYNFNNVTTGIKLAGIIEGSSRDALHVTVNAKQWAVGIDTTGADLKYHNATITWNGGRQDGWTYRSLNMDNCTFNVKDVWLFNSAAQPFNIKNSDVTIEGRFNPTSWRGGHVLSIYEDVATITNSNVTVVGSRVNVIHKDGLHINDSTFTVKDSPDGGFNVNYGSSMYVNNSTIKSENAQNALIAAGYSDKSNLYISGSSSIETAAADQADSVGVNGTYVATGGTFKVYPGKLSNPNCVPTNGKEHGNEKLSLFTLANPQAQSLKVIDKNGASYTYDVAKASPDGQKYVFVPAAQVKFRINKDDAQQQVSGSFTDGAKEKTALAMRGHALSDATSVINTKTSNVSIPDNPIAVGYDFGGWYYTDATGEHPYNAEIPVTSDLTVYAKWTPNADSYGVVYHTNYGDTDTTFNQSFANDDRSATITSIDDAIKANPAFKPAGRTFVGWNTKPDGTGTSYVAGDTATLEQDAPALDLYAQWKEQTFTVRFSANGGTFNDDSVFKTNPKLFRIEQDAQGGEVAVLIPHGNIVKGISSLDKIIKQADDSQSVSKLKLSSTTSEPNPVAARKFYVQDPLAEKSWFWTNYYAWTADEKGENKAEISGYADLTGDTTYYLRWKVDPAVQDISAAVTLTPLEADIFQKDPADTKDTAVLFPGEKISLTGVVSIESIKEALRQIDADHLADTNKEDVKIFNTASTFEVSLKLPDGYIFADDAQVTVDGTQDMWTTTSAIAQDRKSAAITFKLAHNYTTYAELEQAIMGLGINTEEGTANAQLSATVSGVMLDPAAQAPARGYAEGTVTGSFSSFVQKDENTTYKLNLIWDSVQSEAGKDPDQDGIVYALEPAATQELPADLLVNGNTTATQAYEVLAQDVLEVTGKVDITGIKQQMAAIEALYPQTDHAAIKTKVSDFEMLAHLTLPEALTLPDALTADTIKCEGFGPGFEVKQVTASQDGHTLDLVLGLKGNLEDYASYPELEKAVDGASQEMSVTIPGVKVASSQAPLTITAYVSGRFKAVASTSTNSNHTFAFAWSSQQTAEGQDVHAATLAPAYPKGTLFASLTEVAPQRATLPGDIQIGNDTLADAPYVAFVNSTDTLTGRINIESIKQQMQGIEELSGNPSAEDIAVDVKNFVFTATLTLPKGISFSDAQNIQSHITTRDFGNFVLLDAAVTEDEQHNQKLTVSFKLDATVATYQDLKAAVASAGDNKNWMSLDISDVRFDEEIPPTEIKQIVGTVEGSFIARASMQKQADTQPARASRSALTSAASSTPQTTKEHLFAFEWNAIQWPEGKDSHATNDTSIVASVTMHQDAPQELPGDLLANGDSEHTQPIDIEAGSSLTLTGKLDVSSIQQQLQAIESTKAPEDTESIKVRIHNFGFTATLLAPDGITWPEDIVSKVKTENFGGFEVDSAATEGQKLTIKFRLAEEVTDYSRLKELVMAAGPSMAVDVADVQVASNLEAGSLLTIQATVVGNFQAQASTQSDTEAFAFSWLATQTEEGRDALAQAGDKNIQLTLKVIRKEEPVGPVTPPNPTTPTTPGAQTPTKPQAETTTKVVPQKASGKITPATGDSSNQFVGVVLALLGSAVCAAATLLRRKQEK